MKILPLVLQSLESIVNLDYPGDRYELIVVDNGSTDGSFERVREFLEKKGGLRKKIVKLGKNLGFAGGNNVGFLVRDRESRYVVLVNNDCVVFSDSVKLYVDAMENFPGIGALQGVILKLGVKDVDSAGIYLSDLFIPFRFPKNSKEVLSSKVFLCSAVEGTFSIFRVEALVKSFNVEKVFEEILYGFGEDVFTSIQLWRNRYRVAFIAKAVAIHRRGSTWVSPTASFLSARNFLAMAKIFSKKYTQIPHTLILIRKALTNTIYRDSREQSRYILKGLIESGKLSRKLTQKYPALELPQTMPLIHIPITKALKGISIARAIQIYVENTIIKNLDNWTIGKI
jgi:GT2 family glycosyltransferase